MHDLAFWRSLRHRKIDTADLVAKLREAAEWPELERLPFLGFLPPLFAHADPGVRAAAVACLAGCVGCAAFELMVAALNDPDADVRLAAVEALRTSAMSGHAERWAHVLFHPRGDVRQAGLRLDRRFPPPAAWAIYLLPDPVCAAAARQKIEGLVLTVEILPVLIGYARLGVITRAEARTWACRNPWPVVLEFFSRWGQRGPEVCQELLTCLAHGDGRERILALSGFDPLDDLLELFSDAEEPEPLRWLADALRRVVVALDESRWRFSAALLVNLARASKLPAPSLLGRPAAVLDPRLLTCPWLPLATRRDALQGFYDLGEFCPRLDRESVFRLLDADICRRTDGLLDLWSVGAVLHLLDKSPYRQLLDRHPSADRAAAFEADPERSVPFFGLSDRSAWGRRHLIREFCLRPRPERTRLLALLCTVVPLDGLDFIASLEAGVACEVALELIQRETAIAEKRIARLRGPLAQKIIAGQLGRYLESWLMIPSPQRSHLGLAILGELSRWPEKHLLVQAIGSLSAPLLHRLLTAIISCSGFTYDSELDVARRLARHGDEFVRAWAAARLQPSRPARGELDPAGKVGLLRAGLCQRLRAQPDPVAPDAGVCAALLACHDLPAEVDAQFARFSSLAADFVKRLDEEMILNWRGEKRLPLAGHIWLYRWDDHLLALGAHLAEGGAPLTALLESADAYSAAILRRRLWEAAARLVEFWHWWKPGAREQSYPLVWTESFLVVLLNHLIADVGEIAARMLALWWKSAPADPVLLAGRASIVNSLSAASADVRQLLSAWIDFARFGRNDWRPYVGR